jgi:response regulator RpfG family c-di-GMP phosphodiesterase
MFQGASRIVRHHHERWDGGGHPDHLKGSEIPFGARVVAVAESYDSMTNDSSYRIRMPPSEAAMVLRHGGGGQWDPEAVDALVAVLGEEILAAGSRRLSLVLHGEAEDV